MFYLSTAYGYYCSSSLNPIYTPDIRKARIFGSFDEADIMAKCLLASSNKRYYAIVKPA